jgi:RNA polymerase sigma-B factor
MRFYANMTQVQIAAEVGLSQMHVSRLLTQSLRAREEIRSVGYGVSLGRIV